MGIKAGNIEDGAILPGKYPTHAVGDTTPGQVLLYEIDLPIGAASTDITIPTGTKVKVIDVWAQKTNAATAADAWTVQAKSTANPITDVLTGANPTPDKTVLRAATIDDAFATLSPADVLRITTTTAGDATGIAYVKCVKVV